MQCENCEKITGGLANMGRGVASAEGEGVRGVPLPNKGGDWGGGCASSAKIC